jgi:hypothetical protein
MWHGVSGAALVSRGCWRCYWVLEVLIVQQVLEVLRGAGRAAVLKVLVLRVLVVPPVPRCWC